MKSLILALIFTCSYGFATTNTASPTDPGPAGNTSRGSKERNHLPALSEPSQETSTSQTKQNGPPSKSNSKAKSGGTANSNNKTDSSSSKSR
jgi:hypothetical protein